MSGPVLRASRQRGYVVASSPRWLIVAFYCWLFMREMRGVEKWRSWTREGLSDRGCEMGGV